MIAKTGKKEMNIQADILQASGPTGSGKCTTTDSSDFLF